MDDVKRNAQKELVSINYAKKELQQRELSALWALSDPEKAKKLYDVVTTLHGSILDSDERILERLVEETFKDSPDIVEWYKKNKNSRFFKSGEVFDYYSDHSVQKDMVKKKAIGKRTIKKSKTANQHVTTMHEAKHNYLLKLENIEQMDRIDELEKKFDARISAVEKSLLDVLFDLDEVKKDLSIVQEDLEQLYDKVEDRRKIQAYLIRKGRPDFTNTQIAQAFGVNRRTLYRWIKEIEALLYE